MLRLGVYKCETSLSVVARLCFKIKTKAKNWSHFVQILWEKLKCFSLIKTAQFLYGWLIFCIVNGFINLGLMKWYDYISLKSAQMESECTFAFLSQFWIPRTRLLLYVPYKGWCFSCGTNIGSHTLASSSWIALWKSTPFNSSQRLPKVLPPQTLWGFSKALLVLTDSSVIWCLRI